MGPVRHVYTLHPQMGNRSAGRDSSWPLVGSEHVGRASGHLPSLRIQVKVSLPDPCSGHMSQEAHCLWNMQSVDRDTALDILMLKQLLVIYVVL